MAQEGKSGGTSRAGLKQIFGWFAKIVAGVFAVIVAVGGIVTVVGGPKTVADSYEALCTGPGILTAIGGWFDLDCDAYRRVAAPSGSTPSPANPAPQTPLEDIFTVSPVSWGRDLTVTVRKARTGYKGNIVVFWCNPGNGHYGWIGESAFGSASDEYSMGGEYDADNILIGINVTPEDGDPKTVLSAWDLKNLRRTKPPTARPGNLQCLDFAGEN